MNYKSSGVVHNKTGLSLAIDDKLQDISTITTASSSNNNSSKIYPDPYPVKSKYSYLQSLHKSNSNTRMSV